MLFGRNIRREPAGVEVGTAVGVALGAGVTDGEGVGVGVGVVSDGGTAVGVGVGVPRLNNVVLTPCHTQSPVIVVDPVLAHFTLTLVSEYHPSVSLSTEPTY